MPPEEHWHPLTGQVIEWDNPAVLESLLGGLEEWFDDHYWPVRREAQPMFELRSLAQARLAELRGPAHLPRPSRRSELQQKVACCPRCNGQLEEAR